jgi:hypothetical protein
MKLRVLYHGHCFDGVASAATFTRFYLERVHAGAEVAYGGLLHRPNNLLFDRDMFDGDENAIVDFKYSTSEKLTWWFDHHQSAFLTPEDEAHFRADTSGKKFLDATRKSCTEFIADVASEKFGFNAEPLRDLVHWAHIIDGAFYESAAQCVELKEPALQLMQVIEGSDEPFIEQIIRDLTQNSLHDVATSDKVQQRFAPILKLHRETLDAIKRKAASENDVVQFDLVDEGFEGFNKFIPYYLFPDATYTVALTRAPQRTKISVGSNPWAPRPRRHNIATICERYGGGGHAVVGAISFAPDEVDKGRVVMREIVQELSE